MAPWITKCKRTPPSPFKELAIRILVVDDDVGIRRFVEKVLVLEGHDVTLARNGVEATQALDLSTFALILTDLVMPERDGMELLRQVRKQPSPPRVIAMSGGGPGGGAQYLEMAAHLGAAATIKKPFTGGELTAAIQRLGA